MFSVKVFIFLFLHQCQSKLIYVKGLFTPFYTINKNFKTAFQKKIIFFSFFLRKIRVLKHYVRLATWNDLRPNDDFIFFVIKLYKVTLITSYNRQTPSDQKVYKGARVSYSKCLQSKIVYVMFSCKNSLIRGKLHTLHLLGKKRRQRKTGPKALVFHPREMFYWVRIKETLSLNALRVVDSVILCDIG